MCINYVRMFCIRKVYTEKLLQNDVKKHIYILFFKKRSKPGFFCKENGSKNQVNNLFKNNLQYQCSNLENTVLGHRHLLRKRVFFSSIVVIFKKVSNIICCFLDRKCGFFQFSAPFMSYCILFCLLEDSNASKCQHQFQLLFIVIFV